MKLKTGFTLVELLVAIALVGMAITTIGSIIISQLRENISQELQKQLVDDWGRVAEFVNQEIFASERGYAVDGSTTGQDIIEKASAVGSSGVCGFASQQIQLSLVLQDATTYITYAVMPITDDESRIWRGPYVLKRCGPLSTDLNGDGSLTGQATSSILIGGLPKQNSFDASRGMNALGGAIAARDIRVSLTVSQNNLSHSGILGGQARVNPSYNLLNDEATTGDACNAETNQTALLCGSGTLEFTSANCPLYSGSAISRSSVTNLSQNCGLSRIRQFKPLGVATVIGSTDSGIDDVVYFAKALSSYTISTICNRTLCTVTDNSTGNPVTVRDGNVLVFRDRELRL